MRTKIFLGGIMNNKLTITLLSSLLLACGPMKTETQTSGAESLSFKIQELNRLPRVGVDLTLDFSSVAKAETLEVQPARPNGAVLKSASITGDGGITSPRK